MFNVNNTLINKISLFNKNIKVIDEKINFMIIHLDKLICSTEKSTLYITDLKKNLNKIKLIKISDQKINCFSTFENLLIVSFDDSKVKIFNFDLDFTLIKTIDIGNFNVTYITKFNNFLILGLNNGNIYMVNMKKDYELTKIRDIYNFKINSMILKNDLLFVKFFDKKFFIIDLGNDLKKLNEFSIDDITNCNILIYKNYLIYGSYNNLIKFKDLNKDSNNIISLDIHSNYVRCLEIYKNYLISGSNDTKIKITDIENNNLLIKTINIHNSGIKCLKMYNNNLISVSNDNFFRFNDISNKYFLNHEEIKINSFLIYKQFIILGNLKINVIDKNNFNLLKTIVKHTNFIWCLESYKEWLISGSEDRSIIITDINNDFKVVKTLKIHLKSVVNLKIYKDALISSSYDNTIKFSNLFNNFETFKVLNIGINNYKSLFLHGDILFTGQKKIINIIDIKNKFKLIKVLNIHSKYINCFEVYESSLFSGSNDNKIYVTNLNTYKVEILEYHESPILCMAIFKNLLFSASYDKKIQIADIKNKCKLIYSFKNDYYIELFLIDNFTFYFLNKNKNLEIFKLENKYNIENNIENLTINVDSLHIYKDILISNLKEEIEIYDLENKNLINTLTFNKHELINLIIIYRKFLILSNNYNQIKILNIEDDFRLIKNKSFTEKISCFEIYENLLIIGFKTNNKVTENLIYLDLENNFIIKNQINIFEGKIVFLKKYRHFLIAGINDKNIILINLKNDNSISKKILMEKKINCVEIYKNLIIFGTFEIKFYDLENDFELIKNWKIHNNYIRCLIKYKDWIISGSDDKYILVTNIEDNFKLIKKIKIHYSSIKSIVLYKDILISTSKDYSIKFTNLKKFDIPIYINEILFNFYTKFIEKDDFNFENIDLIFNLLNNNSNHINSILSNYYFKVNSIIIKNSQKKDIFKDSLEFFGYDQLFYYNNSDENLFNLIIEGNHIKIFLPTLLNYLKNKNLTYEIDYEKFIRILRLIKNDDLIFNELHSYILQYSKIDKKIKDNKLINMKDFIICKSKDKILKEKVYKKFIKKYKGGTDKKYIINNFAFKIPDSLSKNFELFNILERCSENIKLSSLKYLVNYFFNDIYYIKFGAVITFIIMIISLVLYIHFEYLVFLIFYIITIVLFFLYELIQLIFSPKSYFENYINYFDILFLITNSIAFGFFITNKYEKFNSYLLLLFYINWIKLIIFIKSFNYLRKQVRLFIKIFISILQFIVFTLVILIYLSAINFLINHKNPNQFWLSFFNVYGMMLGAFNNDYENFNVIDFSELFVNTYLFNIIFLNLLISFIAHIFQNYKENEELYDISEKISSLKEYSSIYLFFELISKVFDKLWKKRKNNMSFNLNESFYFFIITEESKKENINNFDILYSHVKELLIKQKKENKEIINNLKQEFNNKHEHLKESMIENFQELKNMIIDLN